jgi:predicted anti-sigma-YlaC factor YlaD
LVRAIQDVSPNPGILAWRDRAVPQAATTGGNALTIDTAPCLNLCQARRLGKKMPAKPLA